MQKKYWKCYLKVIYTIDTNTKYLWAYVYVFQFHFSWLTVLPFIIIIAFLPAHFTCVLMCWQN